jgi:hypothetical protein
MQVTIEGFDLPGRCCGPNPDGGVYENVHVGLRCRKDAIELTPGDAETARWDFDITVKPGSTSAIDFGGPFVHGRRGERCVYLQWGTVDATGFTLFRAAKLKLDEIDRRVIDSATRPGHRLVARIGLTDAKGHPRCASVKPPNIEWSAAPDNQPSA